MPIYLENRSSTLPSASILTLWTIIHFPIEPNTACDIWYKGDSEALFCRHLDFHDHLILPRGWSLLQVDYKLRAQAPQGGFLHVSLTSKASNSGRDVGHCPHAGPIVPTTVTV